jgi:ParB family chromosome partitioning protein
MSNTATFAYLQKTIDVSSIKIGNRLREECGDLDSLAKSISQLGLLQSPIISTDNFLIVGYRRYLAVKKLGWREIPVRIMKKSNEGEENHGS